MSAALPEAVGFHSREDLSHKQSEMKKLGIRHLEHGMNFVYQGSSTSVYKRVGGGKGEIMQNNAFKKRRKVTNNAR